MVDEEESNYETLRKQIELLTQERDCAVEMWNLAELVVDKTKEEMNMKTSNSVIESLKKEIEDIKQDYSQAINLLENKVFYLEKELKVYKENRNEIIEENKQINAKLLAEIQARQDLELCLKSCKEKVLELDKHLEDKKLQLKQSEERENEAREKVCEALESLQEALDNTEAAEDEKEKLVEKLNEIVVEVNEKSKKEMDSLKSHLNSKIETLATQLHTTTLEKNKFSLECESLKSEVKLKLQEIQMKNKSLIQELNTLRNQRQHESVLFHDERNSLRRQLNNLQTELESALLQSRDKQQAPCHECMELQEHVERFSLLCKKWEDAASSITLNFEKYAQETKQFYQLQEKAYHLQNGIEHA